MSTHPPCAACSGPVKRHSGERPSEHNARKTCSRECMRALIGRHNAMRTRLPYRHPPCVQCGERVIRSGSETRERWQDRRHCSVNCRRNEELAALGWPENTGRPEVQGQAFAEHNVETHDDGIGRLPLPPETHVETQGVLA